MSRSYKAAVTKDNDNRKTFDKRNAAKAVRNNRDIPNGGAYKKLFCSYDIADFVSDERFDEESPARGAKWTRKGWVVPK